MFFFTIEKFFTIIDDVQELRRYYDNTITMSVPLVTPGKQGQFRVLSNIINYM